MVSPRLPFDYKWVRYGLVLFTAIGVTVLSVIHSPESATDFQCEEAVICLTTGPFGLVGADKWGHGIAYAILTATLAYAFVAPARTNHRTRLALSVCLAVVFGICLEFVQWPIPNRTMSGIDAIANTIGASLLALIWWWRIQNNQKSNNNITSS